MAITGLKTWSDGDALNTTNLNNDKTILAAKFNGNITNADISASAAIDTAKLSAKHYEIVLNMKVEGVAWTARNASTTKIVAVAGLPADVTATQYDIVEIDWCFFCGANNIAAAPAFDIDWGYFGSDTVWTTTTAVKNAQSTGTLTAQQGSIGVIAAPAASVTTSTTRHEVFALRIDTVGDFDAADQELTVSIKLKRNAGLRT